MGNNVTGGIILLLVGAGIIALAVTNKGQQIIGLITGQIPVAEEVPQSEESQGNIQDGQWDIWQPYGQDPTLEQASVKVTTPTAGGYVGEKGAVIVV